jgi:hypothetical protein
MKLLWTILFIASLITASAPAQEWAKARLDASPRHLEWVKVKDGQREVNCFLAFPERKDKAIAVVVVHEIFGLSGSLAEALTVRGQPDGVGVWGRWNANGPGIACLFNELQLGPNFTSFEDAQPGDFMKDFFADAVGRREHSLSMIYLGREQQNGVEMVRVWSSIKPFGYGEAVIPRARISFAIFSRLETPANIAQAPRLAVKNNYLASLLTADSSKEEAMAKSGVR